jgi:hypothetical protein
MGNVLIADIFEADVLANAALPNQMQFFEPSPAGIFQYSRNLPTPKLYDSGALTNPL